MSRQSPVLPDLTIQVNDINAQLNASVLGIFMMGMYTIVYLGTMYICLNVRIAQGRVVRWAISLLYIFGIIEMSFEWAFLRWFFVKNGETRETVFISLLQLPRWIHVMNNLFAFAMLILADGLLLWRCFNIWGSLWHVISFPLFLYVAEIGLFVSSIIMLFIVKAEPTHHQALTVDRIESVGYSVSAATSITATFLIAYRIWALSKGGLSETWRRFKHVVEILVQSVAVYSVALVVQAVSAVVPFTINNDRLLALEAYSAAILIPITGIAPTVMVARVILSANQETNLWLTANAGKSATLCFNVDETSGTSSADQRNTPAINAHDVEKGESQNQSQ